MNSYVVIRGVGELRLEKGPVQDIEAHEVLVRMSWVGICGSDVSLAFKGKLADYELEPPLGVGHEASGVVAKCGSGVKNLKAGDRVALEPGDPCGSCQFCRGGHYNTCETSCFHSSPVPNPGCLSRYYKHRADLCHKLPDTVSLEEGALIEPFAVAIHACRRSGVSMGTSVLICGAGPLGLLGLVAAKAMGASNILVTDIKPKRLEAAKRMGAHRTLLADGSEPRAFAQRVRQTMGCMPEVSLECSGVESALASTIYATRMCGVVMVMGLPAKDVTLPSSTLPSARSTSGACSDTSTATPQPSK
nr:sorbitol dehydrogenase-like isoform X1 [Penaeus vannamei]